MSAKTRRRVLICIVAIALTLPAETILLRALTQTSNQAAADWAASLGEDQIPPAAANIESLPFAYRRALMARLAPQARAAVWQSHILRYISDHATLDQATLALLYNAAALATAENLSSPSADTRTQMSLLAEQVSVILGRPEAEYLFYRLGPKDVTASAALPLAERLGELVRGTFVVEARVEDCDCHMGFGCDAPNHCSQELPCNKVQPWPACGWWWNEECDGLCLAGLGDG